MSVWHTYSRMHIYNKIYGLFIQCGIAKHNVGIFYLLINEIKVYNEMSMILL